MKMSKIFSPDFKPASAGKILEALADGGEKLDSYLGESIYINRDAGYLAKQKERLAATLRHHISRVGSDAPTILLRAPGRLNAFLEYLDMCGGDHMSTTIDGDIPMALSLRDDEILDISNSNGLFPAERISIKKEFRSFIEAPWGEYEKSGMADNWDNRSLVYPYRGRSQGDWANYVLCPYLRALAGNSPLYLKGATMSFGPATTPFRAGVSSSSAMVVLSFLAMFAANRSILPKWTEGQVCAFLGEAEWYVGTHGGANDQTTILFNPANCVSYNRHSREEAESTPLPFLKGVHVVLANSLWEVNKSMGGNQSFNMRKGWIRMAEDLFDLLVPKLKESLDKKAHSKNPGWLSKLLSDTFLKEPERLPAILSGNPRLCEKICANYKRLGSLCSDILGVPDEAIEEFISLLPVKIRPDEAARILDADHSSILRNYTSPRRDIGGYHARTTARFFHRQNMIGRRLEKIFLEADAMIANNPDMLLSREYDQYKVETGNLVDMLQDALCFDFRVSIPQIDMLLSVAKRGPGYLGGKLTGAGKGGCVSLLVREECSAEMCEHLDREYYSRPEKFEYYRMVLDDEAKYSEPNSALHSSALERLANLEKALASPTEHRRTVTFSRGACALNLIPFISPESAEDICEGRVGEDD